MSDFFVKDETVDEGAKPFNPQNKAGSTTKIPQHTEATESVPPEYVEVKLSSAGKLGAPHTVHVRDYNGKDLMDLSLTADEDMLRGLVDVLNNLMWEEFDARDFTEQDLQEIMLNVYVNFWSPVIQSYPYPYTEEEWAMLSPDRQDRVRKGLEKLEVDINISEQIETHPLPENFKEPLKIEGGDHRVTFQLPRVGHYFVAEDYIVNKYAWEDQQFADVDAKVKADRSNEVDAKRLRDYRGYVKRRNSEYIMAKQAQMITSFDGEAVQGLEDQLLVYPKIDLHMWSSLNGFLENSLQFGVNPNIEMVSPLDGTTVVRRCQFRPVDFLPPLQLQSAGEYTVQFGDE
jgi:hypothetical protein